MKRYLLLLFCSSFVVLSGQNDKTSNKAGAHTNIVATVPATPSICMVSVDAFSQFNHIYWDKTGYSSTDSFIVYRDTANNNFARIGSVPYDALSFFSDTVRSLYAANGDPNVSSWRYKIAVKDSAGNMSAMSPYHQTVFMQDDGQGYFFWSQYIIEGQPVPLPSLTGYACLRDNLGNDAWGMVASVASDTTSFTDSNFSSFPVGRWRNKTMWSIGCNDSTGKYGVNSVFGAINTSRSNIKSPSSVGIKEKKNNEDFYFAPNPAHNELFIHTTMNGTISVRIYNMLGQEMISETMSQKEFSLDISMLDAGTYFLQINGDKGKQTRKLIKN